MLLKLTAPVRLNYTNHITQHIWKIVDIIIIHIYFLTIKPKFRPQRATCHHKYITTYFKNTLDTISTWMKRWRCGIVKRMDPANINLYVACSEYKLSETEMSRTLYRNGLIVDKFSLFSRDYFFRNVSTCF